MDVRSGAISALGWWLESGVDTLVDESPRNWLRPAPTPAAEPPAVAKQVASPEADSLPATIAAMHARLADPSLVAAAIGRPIAPVGDTAAGLMLLADMPEAEDAASGQLLSGDAGRLLDRMLGAIGRDRASAYIATIAPARPAGGRLAPALVPELARLALHHVALAQPRMLLLLGDAPARAILGMGLADARGRIHEINHRNATVGVVATFPPRYLLREQAAKAQAWQDLRMLLGGLNR
jgi:DNA polymerase